MVRKWSLPIICYSTSVLEGQHKSHSGEPYSVAEILNQDFFLTFPDSFFFSFFSDIKCVPIILI